MGSHLVPLDPIGGAADTPMALTTEVPGGEFESGGAGWEHKLGWEQTLIEAITGS